MAPPEMQRIRVPVGAEAFDASAAGPDDGELVILLHGFPQTSSSWRRQVAALGAAGYRAVAPDQRGYSPGARPADIGRYHLNHLVADVLGIADEIGGHRFHLVGHDWGAMVAWHLAIRYPERLRTLTTLSVPHPAAFAAALADPGGDQRERSSYMAILRSEGAARSLLADDAAGLRRLLTSSGMPADADLEADLAVLRDAEALDAALHWYRANDLAEPGPVGPVQVPTLFVWSTGDVALGRASAEATADHVAAPYRFEVLEGVSHWILEEAPDRLTALLLDHLGGRREP